MDLSHIVVSNPEYKPVLIMDIKDDGWANEPDARRKADPLMRQRLDQMLPDCLVPRLYGLSPLRTSVRIYCGDEATGVVTPQLVGHRNIDVLPPDFLEGQWDLDILSAAGFQKMQQIVRFIKEEAAKV